MHSMKTGYIFFWFPLKFAKDYIEQLLVFSLIKGKSIIIQYPISTNNWYDTSFWALFEIQDSKSLDCDFIWTHCGCSVQLLEMGECSFLCGLEKGTDMTGLIE